MKRSIKRNLNPRGLLTVRVWTRLYGDEVKALDAFAVSIGGSRSAAVRFCCREATRKGLVAPLLTTPHTGTGVMVWGRVSPRIALALAQAWPGTSASQRVRSAILAVTGQRK